MERLEIHITLESDDLQHLHALLMQAEHAADKLGEDEVCRAADALLGEVAKVSVPVFVRDRMAVLRSLLEMLRDADYMLPADLRKPVLAALAYFVNPNDLIPDHLPALGFLDDAVMVEVISRELAAELAAYAEFASFRDVEVARRGPEVKMDRESFLAAKRRQMFDSIRARRRAR